VQSEKPGGHRITQPQVRDKDLSISRFYEDIEGRNPRARAERRVHFQQMLADFTRRGMRVDYRAKKAGERIKSITVRAGTVVVIVPLSGEGA
jgi:hypothetical protein